METVAVRLENSRIVHLAGTSADHRGETLIAPACHVGIAGWDSRRLRLSQAPVNCCRCRRLLTAGQTPERVAQVALF